MEFDKGTKVLFAKYSPILLESDPGNLVSVRIDTSNKDFIASEAHCNHRGIPRVERQSDGFIRSEGKLVAACDGCEEFMQGFEKPLENSQG